MKSKTLITLKQFRRTSVLLLFYYLLYNAYFGWNLKPKSNAEEICDLIAKGLAGLAFGLFISALSSFMELVVNYIRNRTYSSTSDH